MQSPAGPARPAMPSPPPLKLNKSRDPLGYLIELFRSNNAGNDLKASLKNMCNVIKNTLKNILKI